MDDLALEAKYAAAEARAYARGAMREMIKAKKAADGDMVYYNTVFEGIQKPLYYTRGALEILLCRAERLKYKAEEMTIRDIIQQFDEAIAAEERANEASEKKNFI